MDCSGARARALRSHPRRDVFDRVGFFGRDRCTEPPPSVRQRAAQELTQRYRHARRRGRILFGGLHAGDWLGGRTVLTTQLVPFQHEATYDILPDSDTAAHFANGALIGSTLAPTARRPSLLGPACALPDRVR